MLRRLDTARRPLSKPFIVIFGALLCLAATPLWVTTLLPFMDYPQFLGFVRSWQDLPNPATPFHGTYTTGFPLSPTVLPLLVVRALSRFMTIETAGKVVYTAYIVGLPLASLRLLRVLDKDPANVLLVFPLVFSFWLNGGFFAYCTGTVFLVLGISEGIRWFVEPSGRRATSLALVLLATFLWHALIFAELTQALLVLWICARTEGPQERFRLVWPIVPVLGVFAAWMHNSIQHRPSGRVVPANFVFTDIFGNIRDLFNYIGMLVPEGPSFVLIWGLLLLVFFRFARVTPIVSQLFRVQHPFAILALVTALGSLVLPANAYGVEGINNRKPWVAALYLVFALEPASRGAMRTFGLTVVTAFDLFVMSHFLARFQRFHEESIGASRLIDRLAPGDALLAPIDGATKAFPVKPLIHVDIYASVRHGGLPNKSFAGYGMNFIQYVNEKNPMPGLGGDWATHPELIRFDWVLLRGPVNAKPPSRLSLVARDGDWALYTVCGSRKGPACRR